MSSIPSLQSYGFVEAAQPRSARPALIASLSVVGHIAALAAVVVMPLLSAEPLPEPAGEVKAFFASRLELAPPPPPPPAPRAAAPVEPPRNEERGAFTAPIEAPSEIVPESALDLGVEGGVASGVEGGVPGGVVGGVVGGLPEPPAPAPQPIRVSGISEPRKLKDVAPVYPDLAVRTRIEGIVIVECLLDTRGRVQEAKVLRGVPILDDAALAAVRQWVYSSTLLDGQPVPVILTVTVTFKLR